MWYGIKGLGAVGEFNAFPTGDSIAPPPVEEGAAALPLYSSFIGTADPQKGDVLTTAETSRDATLSQTQLSMLQVALQDYNPAAPQEVVANPFVSAMNQQRSDSTNIPVGAPAPEPAPPPPEAPTPPEVLINGEFPVPTPEAIIEEVQRPSFWRRYGLWIGAGAGAVILLALLTRR